MIVAKFNNFIINAFESGVEPPFGIEMEIVDNNKEFFETFTIKKVEFVSRDNTVAGCVGDLILEIEDHDRDIYIPYQNKCQKCGLCMNLERSGTNAEKTDSDDSTRRKE
ncbi:MAG: hypothetical protein ACOCT9_02130 [archaeon]